MVRARHVAALAVAPAILGAGVWMAAGNVTADPEASPRPTGPGEATVIEVVDGDTLVVSLAGAEERVRLIGIDTPETVHPTRPVECYGPEASARLAALTPPGTVVRLERDIEPRDQFGRLLAYLYRADDDLFVNHALLEDGYAASSMFPPNTALQTEFSQVERAARQRGTGLWSACGGPDVPLEPRG